MARRLRMEANFYHGQPFSFTEIKIQSKSSAEPENEDGRVKESSMPLF